MIGCGSQLEIRAPTSWKAGAEERVPVRHILERRLGVPGSPATDRTLADLLPEFLGTFRGDRSSGVKPGLVVKAA